MAEEKSKKNYTTIILVVLLIGAAFTIGIFWQRLQAVESGTGSKTEKTAQAKNAPVKQAPAVEIDCKDIPVFETSEGYFRGDENAPITWVEYSDLECPFCQTIHGNLCQLLKEYEGQIKWDYRHFPLEQLHPNARELAVGAECAGQIGAAEKYWEYIDTVFEGMLKDPLEAAEMIGLDENEFTTCMADDAVAQKVQDDYDEGVEAGVRGTPGNFVIGPNGEEKSIPGALPIDQLKSTIEGLL